ncbi:DUF5357 family protein [Roseofilum sp. BLCC_M154]|uniref:DUF5357 family protein n=1 Tax=Roseofilum acuticapitatum BLCC-M154 TaxID=3022444 RepID=A0ABT7AY84_9CYAN|nr:DUF5357 family protein [Roseofilum acuticapitatum]MDJ1171864.1 DUF5357 family protein [Roseofilum acuticapitatum BLCC-M154]
MKHLIQLFNVLFSRPPTLWQILFTISFGFWAMAALMLIFQKEELQELMALLGFISLLSTLWVFLNQWNLRYLGIDLKSIIVWLLFCIAISKKINVDDRWAEKILWITYPQAIALTEILPDVIKIYSVDIQSRESKQRLQRNIIILLSSLLVTCWIYLYFMINEWGQCHSELMDVEKMKNSLFVIPLNLENIRKLIN